MAHSARFSELSSIHKSMLAPLLDDYELAAEKIGWVVPGDRAGGLVPFIPSPPQRHIFQTIREIQAFRYVEQARHLPKREYKEALDIIYHRHRARPERPKFREAWQQTLDFGPAKAIRILGEATEVPINDAVRMLMGKPRQIGGTAVFTWISAWRAGIIDNHMALVIAHKAFAAEYGLAMVRRYLDNWRDRGFEWCFPGYTGRADAAISLLNDSTIDVETAGGKDIRAPKVDFLQLDENAHYDSNASVNAIATAVQDHCWVVKNTTARGVGGQFYADWQDGLYVRDAVDAYDSDQFPERWNRFFRCFTPWWEDPRYIMAVEGEEEARQILANLSDYERAWVERLGPEVMTPGRIKWRRYKVATAADTTLPADQFVAQEFPGDDKEMFQSSGGKPFDPLKLAPMIVRAASLADSAVYLKQTDKGPALQSSQAGTNLVVWRKPRPGAKYVIGADVAQGLLHRDRSWAVVMERVDGVLRRQVATWRGYIHEKAFAHVLALLGEWYNTAFICCVAQPTTTVNTLLQDLHYPQVYRRRVISRVGDQHFDEDSFVGGFLETQSSKKDYVGELIYAFDNGHLEILDPVLLEEMAIYSQNEKGQYGAPSGKHDDGVVALGMASWGDSVLRGAPPLVDLVAAPSPSRFTGPVDDTPRHELAVMAALAKEMEQIRGQSEKPARRAWWLS